MTMPDKNITGWLIVDWKDGSHRTRQSKPSRAELGSNELMAKIDIDVTVPDVDVPSLSLEIDVPEPQVYAATLEAIDDEDLPAWADTANDAVEDNRVAFEQVDTAPGWNDQVAATAMSVLTSVPGRPDPENVREYVDRVASEMVANDGGDE